MIGVGAAGRAIRLSVRMEKILVYLLVLTAWGNIIASVFGPIFHVRGLEPGQSGSNMLMYVLFTVAVLTVIGAMALVVKGAWAARYDGDGASPSG